MAEEVNALWQEMAIKPVTSKSEGFDYALYLHESRKAEVTVSLSEAELCTMRV